MKVINVESKENIFGDIDVLNHKKPRSFKHELDKKGKNFVPKPTIFGREYFDVPNKLSGYDGYHYDGRWTPVAEKIISQYCPNSFLDFGCAKGYLVYDMDKLGLKASFGVDVSEYALNNAPKEIRANLGLINGTNIPFPDKSIDLCVSRGVLEHIPEEALDEVISEVMRVSKNQFIEVTGGNTEEIRRYAREWDITHVTIKPEEWWVRKLSSLGYSGSFLLIEPNIVK